MVFINMMKWANILTFKLFVINGRRSVINQGIKGSRGNIISEITKRL
jgi:hypothetical protein